MASEVEQQAERARKVRMLLDVVEAQRITRLISSVWRAWSLVDSKLVEPVEKKKKKKRARPRTRKSPRTSAREQWVLNDSISVVGDNLFCVFLFCQKMFLCT